MKAISLWQPWASAIAIGVKKIETRGFRGAQGLFNVPDELIAAAPSWEVPVSTFVLRP